MRKPNIFVSAVGVSALILSGAVSAQTVPVLGGLTGALTFGELGSGVSDTACETAIGATGGGAAATCNTLATGVGFIQRQIDVDGKTYIQTSIVDGTFASEDYVQITFGGTAGGGVRGVASKMTLSEGSTVAGANGLTVDTAAGKVGFVADSLIYSGWAHSKAGTGTVADLDSEAVIRVDIGDNSTAANQFTSTFSVATAFTYATSTNVMESMDAKQLVVLGVVGDKQVFDTRIKAADTTKVDAVVGTGGLAVGKVDFTAGEMIQVVWVGQTIQGLGTFGSTNLTNIGLTPGVGVDSKSSLSSLSLTGPFGWAPGEVLAEEFGTAPTF